MSTAARILEGGSRVTALRGPTNTGKTHRAIERMLEHRSGMIGLPLRLLAREVYDRLVAARGADAVALVTGEEKRVGADPRWFVCTVEAMPMDRAVSFVAVDEIQLAGDRNRGHVFTDRLLHARGVIETMFLGSDTIEPLLRRLVPEARVVRSERLSTLSWAGCRKVTSLPRRSAVVAFSADRVYETAERIRAVHGGTAVVLGALSPRARNAQVELYQSGEVQYLVATDAIGMGLNMDVSHVAFTARRKFDGRGFRDLTPAELGQIAGRAGRNRSDGTFGTTRELGELEPALIAALEGHEFAPLRRLFWRNSELDFSSPRALVDSLRRPPPSPELVPMRDEEDEAVLAALLERESILERLGDVDALMVLWEACRIPDYRKTMVSAHADLVGEVALHLLGPSAALPGAWMGERLDRLDNTVGDIEALMTRIAYIRTLTYITHQRRWMEHASTWAERAREVEDHLSDALHERLTKRFVDRRALISRGGAVQVRVEGHQVFAAEHLAGHLRGLSFEAAPGVTGAADRGFRNAVRRGLSEAVAAAIEQLCSGESLELDGHLVRYSGGLVGRVEPGPTRLEPRIIAHRQDLLDTAQMERVRQRLRGWLAARIDTVVGAVRPVPGASPQARAVLYALELGLGSVPRRQVDRFLRRLDGEDKKLLARQGVRLGALNVFLKNAAKTRSAEVAAWLHNLWKRSGHDLPADGRVAVAVAAPSEFYDAIAFRVIGPLAVRVDVLERATARLRDAARGGARLPVGELASWLGCGEGPVRPFAEAAGFVVGDDLVVRRPASRRGRRR